MKYPSKYPNKTRFTSKRKVYETYQNSEFSRIILNKLLLEEKVIGNKNFFCCFQIINGKINQYEPINFLNKCSFSSPKYYTTNFISQVEINRKEWLNGCIVYVLIIQRMTF